ncbi:16S rRNA (cytosine(967)-C(5))-methyltransferase RsmB, partial [Candidatus Thioglobus sp.]|nr:16S rRNA (cytosine(967)-C(5))-methyltransferase RsmB [Candidatus Thioglobus sp.]
MLNNENSRVIAHKAICLVALEKQALSDALFPAESTESPFAKSLVYGSIRYYHHLNDIITPRIKKPLERKNL